MTKQAAQGQLERYANLMQEIKERTLSIEPVVNGKTGLYGPLAREFCYLQLRLICECIALSCLVAHDDLKSIQSSKFQTEFAADLLIKKLETLHPDFYPHPVRFTILEDHVHVAEMTEDYLKKSELVKLVRQCGDKLHRGSARKYTFSPTQEELENDFEQVMTSAKKVLRLLEQHKVNLSSGVEYTFCILSYGPDAKVQVFSGGPKK